MKPLHRLLAAALLAALAGTAQAQFGDLLRQLPIPEGFATGDYAADPAFRRRFQQWLSGLWQEKDRQVEELLQGA